MVLSCLGACTMAHQVNTHTTHIYIHIIIVCNTDQFKSKVHIPSLSLVLVYNLIIKMDHKLMHRMCSTSHTLYNMHSTHSACTWCVRRASLALHCPRQVLCLVQTCTSAPQQVEPSALLHSPLLSTHPAVGAGESALGTTPHSQHTVSHSSLVCP